MSKLLFDAIRSIAGRPLKQSEVDAVNRALAGDIAETGRRISKRALDFIHSFEGYRATTYPDPGPTGLPVTGGWGTTRDENGQPFKLGRTEPQAYWDALFARDLARFEQGVEMLLGGARRRKHNLTRS